MKASDMIDYLEGMITVHGDLEIEDDNGEYVTGVELIEYSHRLGNRFHLTAGDE